jgi:transcriptional regulator with XRE-family HTH domain/tetratricopeptide (TPR) repeat protein
VHHCVRHSATLHASLCTALLEGRLMAETFASLLTAFRVRSRLSKKRLSELARVDRNRLADWEAGKRVPRDYSIVQELAEQLNLSAREKKLFEDIYTAARPLRDTHDVITKAAQIADEWDIHHGMSGGGLAASETAPPLSTLIIGREEAGHHQQAKEKTSRLRVLLHDHTSFIQDRLNSFVGRETELAEIRQRIVEMLPTGGYITITGQAGQGKSSIIAKLVYDSFRAQVTELLDEAPSVAKVLGTVGEQAISFHFIPLDPGRDHQVGLLRDLMSRLILKYDLDDFYTIPDKRNVLSDMFSAILREISKQGGQEVIYIDGLDQIREEPDDTRDLSFLPSNPPNGIVFIVSTRPNDTMSPLKLRKPLYEYKVSSITRNDFDLILENRNIKLNSYTTNRFYQLMEGNALYLDLAAKLLASRDNIEPENLILAVTDNPENIFSFLVGPHGRLARWVDWERVGLKILLLLLVAHQPLSFFALQQLIGLSLVTIRSGVQKLGDVVMQDGKGHVYLYHSKFREYLHRVVFAPDEVVEAHRRLIQWCETEGDSLAAIWNDRTEDTLEYERRLYARQHFLAHLAAAKMYERLWEMIDDGNYGISKIRGFASMRDFIFDLIIAGKATIDAADNDLDEGIRLLPRLWTYSLLRCQLGKREDNLPNKVFVALALLDRKEEALARIDSLSSLDRKIELLSEIALLSNTKEANILLARCKEMLHSISDSYSHRKMLSSLLRVQDFFADEFIPHKSSHAWLLNHMGKVFQNDKTIAINLVNNVSEANDRAVILADLGAALALSGQQSKADDLFAQAISNAYAIPGDSLETRIDSLIHIVKSLILVSRNEQADVLVDQVISVVRTSNLRTSTLANLAATIIQIGRKEEATSIIERVISTAQESGSLVNYTEALYSILATSAHIGGKPRKDDTNPFFIIACAIPPEPNILRWQMIRRIAATLNLQFQAAKTGYSPDIISQYADYAAGYALAGFREEATSLFDQVLTAAYSIPTDKTNTRIEVFATVATALFLGGRQEKAMTILVELRRVTHQFIDNLISPNLDPTIPDSNIIIRYMERLTNVAIAVSLAGRTETAHIIFTEADSISHAIPEHSPDIRVQALNLVGDALIYIGQQDKAASILSSAFITSQLLLEHIDHPDKLSYDFIFIKLARSLIRVGLIDMALDIIKSIPLYFTKLHPDMYIRFLVSIFLDTPSAYQETASVMLENIMTIFHSISDSEPEKQASALISIIDTVSPEKDQTQFKNFLTNLVAIANVLCDKIPKITYYPIEPLRDSILVLVNIITKLSYLGEYEHSKKLLDGAYSKACAIQDAHLRNNILVNLANAFISTKQADRLLTLARREIMQARTLDELLPLFPLICELVHYQPAIAESLFMSFAWTESQLQAI